jgi:thioredoxin reductase (NADPH)
MVSTDFDVAIIGAGPAGLQAALVLARTRKRVIVFNSPHPPRNAASHGVHNFVGLDGLLPAQIQAQAWAQIAVYDSAQLHREQIIDVQPAEAGFLVQGDAGTTVTARHVVLAMGCRDLYPDIPGFMACWANTIIPCPFCDGYENRDRLWGMVATSGHALEHMPMLFKHWTTRAVLFIPPALTLSDSQRAGLEAIGIPVHVGAITEVHHTAGRVEAVTLDTGERVAVETLWWHPDAAPLPLTTRIIETFALEQDEAGAITTDTFGQTSRHGLWAVGDVKGWTGALGSAYAASQAATAIIRGWHTS